MKRHAQILTKDTLPTKIPLMHTPESIKRMESWKGFGPYGLCGRCGSKWYGPVDEQARNGKRLCLCCDCGFTCEEDEVEETT